MGKDLAQREPLNVENFLLKYGSSLEDMIFSVQFAPKSILSDLYAVLKSKYIEAAVVDPYACYAHTMKITKDAIVVLGIRKTKHVASCLSFLSAFFENTFAVYVCSHSNMTELCSALRNVLTSPVVELHKGVIRILIQFLASKTPEDGHGERIPQQIVRSDLDHHIYDCVNTNDAELINLAFRFYRLLCTKEGFKYERQIPTLEHCLRVFTMRLELEGLDKPGIHSYFMTCMGSISPLNSHMQQLILSLSSKIMELKNWTRDEKVPYLDFLTFCKDPLGTGPLLEILQTLNLNPNVFPWLQKFLTVSETERTAPEPELLPISPKFHDMLRNLQFSLINFLCMRQGDPEANYIWAVMAEILKYCQRRFTLNPEESKNLVSDIVLSAPLQLLIENCVYMDDMEFSRQRFDFFQLWVSLVKVTHTIPWSSTRICRPTRLEILFTKVEQSIRLSIEKMPINSDNKKKLEPVASDVEYILRGMERQRKTDEEWHDGMQQ